MHLAIGGMEMAAPARILKTLSSYWNTDLPSGKNVKRRLWKSELISKQNSLDCSRISSWRNGLKLISISARGPVLPTLLNKFANLYLLRAPIRLHLTPLHHPHPLLLIKTIDQVK